jgi:ABC-type transport system involved in multi-copper enzyme maturation permease subunit
MNSMTVLAIARNTFREHIRDKILYNLVLFALIMILSAVLLGQLTLGHEDKVIVDLGLTSISIFGTVIAIFIGTSLVYKEIEKKTVYVLLSKPISRAEFVLGKYLGLLWTLLINVAVMAAGMIMTMIWQGGADVQRCLRLMPAVYLILLALALTTAIALLFSTFSTPALSALFTLFLWVIGHFNSDLLAFGALTKSGSVKWLCRILYYVLPNFSNFNIIGSANVIESAAYYRPIDMIAVGWITLYGFLYSGVLLLVTMFIFSRREFK